MRLTAQMQAEVERIRTRVDLIQAQAWVPLIELMKRRSEFLAKDKDTAHATIAELNPYKIRLENILSETDMKERARSPMIFFTFSQLNLVAELVNELV